MSHFNVLVIGEDLEAALQPFHEFECTGVNDQYVQDVDVTQECAENADEEDPLGLGYHGLTDKQVSDESEVDRNGTHQFGFAVVHDGKLVKAVNRTNPNKKWDWWVLGGRWTGKLLLKEGRTGTNGKPGLMTERNADPRRCDAALAGDIDWDGMLAEHAQKAGEFYDKVIAGIAGRPVQPWSEIYARVERKEITIEAARDQYHGQDVVKELQAAKVLSPWDGAEDLACVLKAKDRQSYIDREAKENSCTWALLWEGKWHEKGSMGWFGMSDATDASKLDYVENFWLTIRALPDTAHVAVVDCHI